MDDLLGDLWREVFFPWIDVSDDATIAETPRWREIGSLIL
jgi:hypothetical protein